MVCPPFHEDFECLNHRVFFIPDFCNIESPLHLNILQIHVGTRGKQKVHTIREVP